MKSRPGAGGLVYSTDLGRTCPACRRALAVCTCETAPLAPAGDGVVRVSRETGGRGGKCVTVVRGLALEATALAEVAKALKAACGSGGTVKDVAVEVQGDHSERVIGYLRARADLRGRVIKRSGG